MQIYMFNQFFFLILLKILSFKICLHGLVHTGVSKGKKKSSNPGKAEVLELTMALALPFRLRGLD